METSKNTPVSALPKVTKVEEQKGLTQTGKEEEHLRAKLAGGRMVRVLFQGPPPTQKEIDKLIALLEISKDQYSE